MFKQNLILIGMPGAGKSTIGVLLAKYLGYRFLDTDILIQEQSGKRLFEIISEQGNEAFLRIENEVNISLRAERTVIATGGSAIYGQSGMKHLQSIGRIVYLKLSYSALKKRLGDLRKRGVALKEEQTLKELYEERVPYYEKYADITINCDQKEMMVIVNEIMLAINKLLRLKIY